MLNNKRDFFTLVTECFKEDFSKDKYLYHIKDITFQVTDGCNLRCSYCYQKNKQEHFMSFDTAKQFIDYMFQEYENIDNKYFYKERALGVCIEFIGGEPLLAADLIYQIIEYFEYQLYQHPDCTWNFFHRYNIGSNGTLLFTPAAQKILQDFSPFVSIPITVDGVKEYHDSCRIFPDGSGSYDLALAAALYMKNFYHVNSTKITISPDNVKYMFEAVKNMYQLGFQFITINCCFENIWGNTEEEKRAIGHQIYTEGIKVADWIKEENIQDDIYVMFLHDQNRYCKYDLNKLDEDEDLKYTCGTNWNMLAIDYKGDIFPCLRFMNSSLNYEQPEYIIGNISHGIGYTEEEKRRLKLLQDATIKKCAPDKCLKCDYGNGCAQCLAHNYQVNGESFKKTTYSCYTEIAFGLVSYYFNKTVNIHKESMKNIKLPNISLMKKILSQEEIEKLQQLK